jgi:glycosyltransferase involved in cell wall biosynthesis
MSQPPTIQTDTNIRVLRVIARMNVGGPAVQITNLMRGLDSSRFDQKLVTGFCEEDEVDYLDSSAHDVSVVRVPGLGRSINLFSDLVSILKVIKIIRSFKPHIVHTHTAKAGVIGRLASVLSGHKSFRVHTFHGHVLHGYFSKNKTKIYVFIEQIFAVITKRFVCVGAKVRNDLVLAGIGELDEYVVFPPGVEKPLTFDREKAARQLSIPSNKTYCLFLGRVTKIKRPDRLIDVATLLKNSGVDVTFLIAGGGDLLDEMKALSESEDLPMIFMGWQHNLDALFSVADILVMTSDNEGTPLSAIQAQLAGIPVVSTNVGSINEILLDGTSAFLTNLEPQQLAAKIEFLAINSKERVEMGKAGKIFAGNKFSPERLVKDHEILYTELFTDLTNF